MIEKFCDLLHKFNIFIELLRNIVCITHFPQVIIILIFIENIKMPNFKYSTLLALSLTLGSLPVFGAENLDAINVSAESQGGGQGSDKTPPKIGEIVKSAQKIAREQVTDAKDLVRYETGITMVEAGRFGTSGFTIRGVDENRVAINVDGLAQAETLSSQGFKELFEGYGNFNNTRNSVEVETLGQAHFTKGADSIKTGSGALGGSIIYTTKDARDYLIDKNHYVSYKSGYTTKNNQNVNSLTAAGRFGYFDALVVATQRRGHELENYDYKTADSTIQGAKREKADPYTIIQDSTLIKFSFNPSDEHRFTVAADLYDNKSRGEDLSYTLKYKPSDKDNVDPNGVTPEYESRHTNDKTKRKNVSFTYENFSSNFLWDTMKITYSQQSIKTRARTDEYCDGSKCAETANPLGLKVENGKIVRQDGSDIELKDKDTFIDSDGSEKKGGFVLQRGDEYWFDCSIYDCSKPMTYWSLKGYSGDIEKKELALDKTFTHNGKTYAKSSQATWKDNVVLPNLKGYQERLWQERDLDTDTKQLNLDLTKSFETFGLEHFVQYGGSYNHSEKKMTNRAGYDATNVQWWAAGTLGLVTKFFPTREEIETCEDTSSWNANLCPRTDPPFSFLIPVKSKQKSLYFTDNLKVNQYLSFDLGYRFDQIRFKPHYTAGITPKLPDDIIKGLFIPLPPNATDEQVKQNVADNIAYLVSHKKKYSASSYSLISNIEPLDWLKVQLKYAKGFRAPTADELYFTFKHPDFTILPNLDLKAEIAKTKEIALTLHDEELGFISTSFFTTKYHNFIDVAFLGEKSFSIANGGSSLPFSIYQNVNRQNAKVHGVEINSKLFIGPLVKALNGFNLSYKYTYQKGRMEGNIPMNAIQPRSMVFGLGYSEPNDIFGVDLFITHTSAKKPEDTYNMYHKEEGKKDTAVQWLSDRYTLIDLLAYYKPVKNITLSAGVYNLTNKRYITWESARSIRPFGTSNRVDKFTGQGIARFTAPGRNYNLSLQVEF